MSKIKTINQKLNLKYKASFTLVELMTPSFKTQAFSKRQNSNEFLKKGVNSNRKASFTLVELMIVIAILAILAAIVIFTLNPSEMFKKNRDSRRMADLQTLNKALVFMTTWNDNVSLGNANTIYLSLPDSSSTCTSYSLPTLPTGFTYNCKTETDHKKSNGDGWVPINFTVSSDNRYITTLPVDPVNSEIYYYSYNPGGSFELNAFFETADYLTKYGQSDGGDSTAFELGTNIQSMPNVFPHNWIKVPGNSLYGTSDFWVMQYEAKYATTGRVGSDTTTECRHTAGYDTYDWNKACGITWLNQNVISSPLGSPIAGVTHNEAKAICTALGARLINNQEWMTIARNIEQQNANWTSGTVGTGYLFNGNSGDATRGYRAFADRYDADKGFSRNARASHILSNNNRIYDFAGNVWEHVLVDSNDTLLNNLPNDGGAGGWIWHELSALTTPGDMSFLNQIQPSNSAWNRNQGMGAAYSNSDIQPNRVMLRGGNFSNASDAGAFATALAWSTTDSSYYVGFRCAR